MRKIRILHVVQAAGGVDRYTECFSSIWIKKNLKISWSAHRTFIKETMRDWPMALSKSK